MKKMIKRIKRFNAAFGYFFFTCVVWLFALVSSIIMLFGPLIAALITKIYWIAAFELLTFWLGGIYSYYVLEPLKKLYIDSENER